MNTLNWEGLLDQRSHLEDCTILPPILKSRTLVIIGAGTVGHEVFQALAAEGFSVTTFIDSNPAKWGQNACKLKITPPAQAVEQLPNDTLYILAIGRLGNMRDATIQQYKETGIRNLIHYTELFPYLPLLQKQHFLAPFTYSVADKPDALQVLEILHDNYSRQVFLDQLAWRATLKATYLSASSYYDQYFPADLIAPTDCTHFVDIGAFNGDTLETLTAFAGGALASYRGYEPHPDIFQDLAEKVQSFNTAAPHVNYHCSPYAIGRNNETLGFVLQNNNQSRSHLSATGNLQILSQTLDEQALDAVTYIKADVEGAEHDVLEGARHTIRRFTPCLAIAAYHRPRDIFDIPLALNRMLPKHLLSLRSHGDAGIDLICYATPPRG